MAECSGLTQLPSSLPDDLDWLILHNNNISSLEYANASFQSSLSKLNLNSTFLEQISNEFLEQFVQLKFLDISNNKLRSLPKAIENMTSLEAIWISGNNFECNCDNIWMRDWVVNNMDIIHDSERAKCQMNSGSSIQIKIMDGVAMGCVCQQIPIWISAGRGKSIL